MRLETFFEKFELFADAPNAVGKMRELVLRLAFSGGLSSTSSGDQGLPLGWEARTIESICSSITPGFACSRSHQVDGGHVHLRTHNISTLGTLNFDLLVRIDPNKVDPQKSSIRCGDILFNNTNSQELVGKTCLVDQDYGYGFSNHITRLRLKDGVFPGFVVFYLTLLRNSGYFARVCTRWINQAAVNTDTLKKQTIPLPLLAEQKRIVAKVDELMALCDRLEAQQQERDTRHAALARASLTRFAEAPTPANLDFLFHTSYAIPPADLRKSILTLAVQGKLVPQDPSEEPAGACLSRLGLKSTLESANGFDESDDSLPPSWTRVRFEDIALTAGGVTLGRKLGDRKTVTLPYLRVANVKRGEIDLSIIKEVSIAEDEIERYALRENDLLMTEGGDWDKVGRAAIWKGQVSTCLHQNHVFRSRMRSDEIKPVWFERYFNSPDGRRYFESASKQTTNLASINMRQVRGCPVPFPPLAEQQRIVAKVDQLMALVDQLEVQLSTAKTRSAALLDAVIHEVLNPTAEVVDLTRYRAAVGCYAISKMQGERYFGRTAAMKALYLAEAHVGLRLGLKPMREAAGPFDLWLYRFEEQGGREAWFKVVESTTAGGKKKIEYRPGRALAEQSAQAERIFTPEQRKGFDRLLTLFSDRTTEEAEIIATLFAAWNDFLIDGHAPDDNEIIREVRENWHEKKERFTPAQLRKWLGWLRQNDVVPTGRPPRTMHQTQLLLN